jgi:putative peptidoglycan lipid II flippase
LWLGLGTSLGVAVQFLCMVPSLARNDLYRLRLRFDFADPALRAIARLGSWTLAVVVTNQVSLYVVLAFAFGIGGNGPVSAYTYGWSFMQMPYAVIVVSVLGVLTPQLAGLATANDAVGFTRRLSQGLRQSLVIIVPCAAALVVLAQPVVGVLLNHGRLSANLLAGSVVAVLAAGLPGFTVFQLCIRGLQALQRARDVFLLYALENGLTIALCFVLGRHSMTGLTGAVSLAYTLSAVVALAVLHVQRVPLVGTLASRAVRRSAVGSLAMAFVMAGAYAAVTWSAGALLLVRVGLAAVMGIVTYGLVLYIGERRDALRRNVEP